MKLICYFNLKSSFRNNLGSNAQMFALLATTVCNALKCATDCDKTYGFSSKRGVVFRITCIHSFFHQYLNLICIVKYGLLFHEISHKRCYMLPFDQKTPKNKNTRTQTKTKKHGKTPKYKNKTTNLNGNNKTFYRINSCGLENLLSTITYQEILVYRF